MNIGNRIEKSLHAKNISRRVMAEKLNISYSAISKYITNTRTPDAKTLKEIAEFLEVTTDYLLDNDISDKDKNNNQFNQAEKLNDTDYDIVQLLIDRLVDDEE